MWRLIANCPGGVTLSFSYNNLLSVIHILPAVSQLPRKALGWGDPVQLLCYALSFEMALHPSVWRHSLLSLFLSLLRSVGEFCWLPLSLLPEWRRRLLPLIRTLRYTCREGRSHVQWDGQETTVCVTCPLHSHLLGTPNCRLQPPQGSTAQRALPLQ